MNKINPLVSVIIPCYNHELYVQDTINSIINQDYENIELIIIDDGSKDNSVSKIKEVEPLCLSRFKRFELRSRPNKGLVKTLNEGLEWCEGKYLSLIASDDMMLPNKTSIQVNYLETHPEITSVFSNAEYIDNHNMHYRTSNLPQEEHTFERILTQCDLFAPSQMHHLAAIKAVGGFDENLIIEDWSMWLKMAISGYRIVLLKDVLAQYRRHEHNMSNNSLKMIIGEMQILDLYQKHPAYAKMVYRLKKKKIKYFRDNGEKLKYYFLKMKFTLLSLFA